jgi:Kef-type K+ transport system membrane component KefB
MNLYLKIALFTTIYLMVLIAISPVIDHAFSELDEDIQSHREKLAIFLEVLGHILVITIAWYVIHRYLKHLIHRLFKIKVNDEIENSVSIVSSVVLVGLQRNLVDKIGYITGIHPIRS